MAFCTYAIADSNAQKFIKEVPSRKKPLAIVLTLALLVTVAAPVFAAEYSLQSRICPACGGTGYEQTEDRTTSVSTTCEISNISHYHIKHYETTLAECEDCGYELIISRVYYKYFCSKSGLYYSVN